MHKNSIRKEGIIYIIILGIITAVSFYFFPLPAIIPFALLLFITYFLRDPQRTISTNKSEFVSPADGKVMEITEISEDTFIKGKAIRTKVLVHQIAGFVARRIECWSNKSDILNQGDKFGLIKFDLCTEIIVPYDVNIKTKKGDIVRGCITVIGVIK